MFFTHSHKNCTPMYKLFQFIYVCHSTCNCKISHMQILKEDDKIGKQERKSTSTCKDFLSIVAHINDLAYLYTMMYKFLLPFVCRNQKKQELQ